MTAENRSESEVPDRDESCTAVIVSVGEKGSGFCNSCDNHAKYTGDKCLLMTERNRDKKAGVKEGICPVTGESEEDFDPSKLDNHPFTWF